MNYFNKLKNKLAFSTIQLTCILIIILAIFIFVLIF